MEIIHIKTKEKTKNSLLFTILLLIFIGINLHSLNDGHDWGGDFSQYILQAQNIANEESHLKSFDLDPWANYPQGFPLLLTPLIKLFGINYKILKLPNIFCWLIFILSFYSLAKKRIDKEIATLCSVLLLSSPFFFFFKQRINSDIPFLAFSTCALFFFTCYSECNNVNKLPQKKLFFFISTLMMCVAFFIRHVGLLLFPAAIIHIALTKKKQKPNDFSLSSNAVSASCSTFNRRNYSFLF